ncbi:NAD-dependent epimerase/dehydratase family protein [Cribrihabitans pelagius]|uniref:NAD-dependent epimerase/dehydratase family protein n=1 Tax=Cribrihabitans pelagius TaxID=1765746 RepID=UPI003B5C5D41
MQEAGASATMTDAVTDHLTGLSGKTICIAGASGLAGAYAVRAALAAGCRVNGTLRTLTAGAKTGALMALPGAAERLQLFPADAADSASFDAPLAGADAVFIACFPAVRRAQDGTPAAELGPRRGWAEFIAPAQEGCLDILRAAARQRVGTVILCSSTASAEPPAPVPVKQELRDRSSLAGQISARKYAQAQKTAMEAAATEFAETAGQRLCVLLPSMMVAPALLTAHLEGHVLSFLAGLRGGRPGWHKTVPRGAMSLTSPEDLAAMALAAWRDPNASGRYFALSGSWSWQRIYQEIGAHVPPGGLPRPLSGVPEPPTRFDFTRRDSLGVAFTGRWRRCLPASTEACRSRHRRPGIQKTARMRGASGPLFIFCCRFRRPDGEQRRCGSRRSRRPAWRR